MYDWVWALICLVFGVVFCLLALPFLILKEKGAVLISGFNSLSKDERMKYDRARMSKEMAKNMLLWSSIFFVGAVVSYGLWPYLAILSFICWIILLAREVHSDAEKAFSKYRLMNNQEDNSPG